MKPITVSDEIKPPKYFNKAVEKYCLQSSHTISNYDVLIMQLLIGHLLLIMFIGVRELYLCNFEHNTDGGSCSEADNWYKNSHTLIEQSV